MATNYTFILLKQMAIMESYYQAIERFNSRVAEDSSNAKQTLKAQLEVFELQKEAARRQIEAAEASIAADRMRHSTMARMEEYYRIKIQRIQDCLHESP